MANSNEDDNEKLMVACVLGTWAVISGSHGQIKVAAGQIAESLDLLQREAHDLTIDGTIHTFMAHPEVTEGGAFFHSL